MGDTATFMGPLKEQKKSEVKKHVATIHCSNTLSLLQRKISNALLYHAYPDLHNKEEHDITIKQLCNIIGYHGNNHAAIKEALKALIATVVEWNLVDEESGEEDWTASAIIACARIKGAKCTYAYSPRMRNLLFSPSMYGKINLIVQARFKSSYGLALYENCVRYKTLPYTRWFELSAFRKLMGVPEDTYPIFRDFKKRVIDKSVEEVNTYSDLIVTPEINRVGRKPQSIRFSLKERAKKQKLGANLAADSDEVVSQSESSKQAELITKLQNQFALSTMQIKNLFTKYELPYIAEKIDVIESSMHYLAGKINNLSAYLVSALEQDFKPSKPSSNLLYQAKKDKELLEESRKRDQLEEERNRNAYSSYISDQLDQTLAELDETQQELIKQRFEKILQTEGNSFMLQKYNQQGLKNKIVKIFFVNFIREEYPHLTEGMLNFDQFMAVNV